jgi:hypothetical protein
MIFFITAVVYNSKVFIASDQVSTLSTSKLAYIITTVVGTLAYLVTAVND